MLCKALFLGITFIILLVNVERYRTTIRGSLRKTVVLGSNHPVASCCLRIILKFSSVPWDFCLNSERFVEAYLHQ